MYVRGCLDCSRRIAAPRAGVKRFSENGLHPTVKWLTIFGVEKLKMHGNKLYVELKLSHRNSNPFIISEPGAVRNRDNIHML